MSFRKAIFGTKFVIAECRKQKRTNDFGTDYSEL